jgi:hypothetical protein
VGKQLKVNRNCPLESPDLSGVEQVFLQPEKKAEDYRQALDLARAEAEKRLGDFLLLSWYDRDRDFESPAHTTESACGPKNGYILYALSRGARLRIDIEAGRFVFFFAPVVW